MCLSIKVSLLSSSGGSGFPNLLVTTSLLVTGKLRFIWLNTAYKNVFKLISRSFLNYLNGIFP